MNIVGVTGYLNGHAKIGYTAEPPQIRKAVFDVMVDIGDGVFVPWRCEIDNAALIDRHEAMLTAGRAVVLDCKLSGRQYFERGVFKNWVRFLRVTGAEFPNRSNPKQDAKPEDPAPVEGAKV